MTTSAFKVFNAEAAAECSISERFVELEAVPVPAPDGAAVYFMEQVLVRDDPQSVREREGASRVFMQQSGIP